MTQILDQEILAAFEQYRQAVDQEDACQFVDFAAGYAAGQQAEREACKQACIEIRADGGGDFKQHEDNHADGFTDGCNECLFAIEERNNVSDFGRNNDNHN